MAQTQVNPMYARYAAYRDSIGYTDYKVSVEAQIPQSTIYDWKKGLYTPKIDKLIKIATIVGMPIEELLSVNG